MANTQRSKRDDSITTSAPAPRSRIGVTLGVLGAVVIGAGAFVAWHRGHDPTRVWARGVEQRHGQKIVQPLARCFGGADGASVRQSIAPARAGRFSPALLRCRGEVLLDVMTEPLSFNADLSNVPAAVEATRGRERAALLSLRTSLNGLRNAQEHSPASGADLTPDQRDALALAVEAVAVDVDAEHTAFDDLLNAAESGASVY